jgi:hypothetical protein
MKNYRTILAATCLGTLALAGCSAAEQPAPVPTVTVTATEPPNQTVEPAIAGGAKITGNIAVDVLAAGYDPDDMVDAIDWVEGWMCDASHEKILDDSEFDRHVRTSGENVEGKVGTDALRVIVHYKCPILSPALETSIADAQERFWG